MLRLYRDFRLQCSFAQPWVFYVLLIIWRIFKWFSCISGPYLLCYIFLRLLLWSTGSPASKPGSHTNSTPESPQQIGTVSCHNYMIQCLMISFFLYANRKYIYTYMYVIYTHSEAFIETCSHRDKADIYLLYRNLLEKSLINMARIENRAPSLEKKENWLWVHGGIKEKQASLW